MLDMDEEYLNIVSINASIVKYIVPSVVLPKK